MIKIGPLLAGEYKQASLLLQLQPELVHDSDNEITDGDLLLRSFTFWQHWLPCNLHMAASTYVAREDKQLLGIISLAHMSKSRSCWQVNKLVVHPDHRGRGIAQELLRYVFAQFGSQGVMHFLAEVPATNAAALTLFANCGFCRSSRITYYKFNPSAEKLQELRTQHVEGMRVALPHVKPALYQLHSEVLPPALRQVLLLNADDFQVKDWISFTSVEKSKQKLMRTRVWYWISEDTERMVLTSSARVTADPNSGYKLEFAIHPGWKHLEEEVVNFSLTKLLNEAPKAPIWVKVYDFQGDSIHSILQGLGFERSGEEFVLLREHWQRSRKTKLVEMPQLGNPVINLPLAADQKRLRRLRLQDPEEI